MLSTSSKMLDSSPRLGGAKSVPRDFWMLRKMQRKLKKPLYGNYLRVVGAPRARTWDPLIKRKKNKLFNPGQTAPIHHRSQIKR
jgi:hypothetical protein